MQLDLKKYFGGSGDTVLSTNGNIFANLKMVILFLPQLADLVHRSSRRVT